MQRNSTNLRKNHSSWLGLKCLEWGGAKGAGEGKTLYTMYFVFRFCFAKYVSVMLYHHSLELTDVLQQSVLRFSTPENPGLDQKAFPKKI